MKTLENRKVVLPEAAPAYMAAGPISYVQLCIDCLRHVNSRGSITPEDMAARQRVIVIIQNTDVQIDLDDDIVDLIKKCVDSMEWKKFDVEILDFCNYIDSW